MDDLALLYQEMILDHCRHPRHFGKLNDATNEAEGINPLCGDEVKVYLKLLDDCINALQFTGKGCAISMASASLMSEHLQGKSSTQAKENIELFLHMLTDKDAMPNESLGKLQVLYNVRNYPIRIKCATLPWHAFLAALENHHAKITTEAP